MTSTFKDNYYFSIRRYPYSADMAKNPLTFKHISANVVLPVGPPRNPTERRPNNEVHNAGEIWCCALWEVFVNLVAKHGHAEAEERMLRYVIGGVHPGPRRDHHGGVRPAEDLSEVWAGFAKRGMGSERSRRRRVDHPHRGGRELETPAGPWSRRRQYSGSVRVPGHLRM